MGLGGDLIWNVLNCLNEPCSSFTLGGKFSILNGSAELDIVRSYCCRILGARELLLYWY